MFTRTTTSSYLTKAVLVLMLLGLLLPLVSFAQGRLDTGGGQTFTPTGTVGGDDTLFSQPVIPPTDLIGGDDLLFQQPVVAADGVNNSQANTNNQVTDGVDNNGNPVTREPAGAPVEDSFAESALKALLYTIVVNLFGTLLGWAGMLLNFSINTFVIGFGTFFTTQGVGVAVNDLWALVRDFFNILFIFGFIYIGFQMILNSGNSAAKKTLASLIAAALLVNFSLFISKFVVDFSNRIASEIAQEAFPAATANQVNVADTFFGLMGIPKTLDVSGGVRNNQNAAWSYIFGSAIFYLVATFVFAAGAIMLTIRFVALSIFMVLSPFMFLGWVFPNMQTWTSKYWKGFLGRAFYAPVYIILLFFAGNILQNFFGPSGSMQNDFVFGELGRTSGSLADILPAFILSCAFLIAAVIVAGKMSADGASGVMKVGNNLQRGGRRRLQNGAIGLGRFGVRNTAGLATSYGVNRAGEAGRESLRRRNARLADGNSFDRWRGRLSERTTGAALDRVATATIAGSETRDQRRQRIRSEQAALNTAGQQTDRTNRINSEMETVRSNGDINDPAQRTARRDAMNAVYNQVRRMSNDEVLRLDRELLESPEFAQHLTDGHVTALRESGIYTNSQVRDIGRARDTGTFDTISETLDSTNASAEELNTALDQLAQTVQRMPADRLQGLDVDTILTNPRIASNLTERQLEDLQNSGRLNATQMTSVRQARADGLTTIASGGVGSIAAGSRGSIINSSNGERNGVLQTRRERLLQGNAQTAGQLPPEVFQQTEMAQFITPTALQQRIRNGINQSDLTLIEDNLRTYLAGSSSSPREITMWQNWQNGRTTEAARVNIF